MIINGGKRTCWRKFAPHLMNIEEGQQKVRIVEMRGLAADNLEGAFHELEALGRATRAKNFYYHANIDPRADEHMSEEQWEHAADLLEKNLGLEGRSRFVVEHEKDGRTHRHVVWSRVTDEMKVVPCDWNYAIHQRTADELEKEFGHEATPRRREPDKPRGPENWEYFRGKQTRIPVKQVEAELTAIWGQSDSPQALAAAVAEHGYILAEGDRGLCVVDWAGKEHSLARRVGLRQKDVDARMAGIDRDALPSVDEARELARERADKRDDEDEKQAKDQAQDAGAHTGKREHKAFEELVDAVRDAVTDKDHPRETDPIPQPVVEASQVILPPEAPPGILDLPQHEPSAFERFLQEAMQAAKDAAPVVAEVAVAAAAAEEPGLPAIERAVGDARKTIRPDLAEIPAVMGPPVASSPEPPPDEVERMAREMMADMREGAPVSLSADQEAWGGQMTKAMHANAGGDGMNFWERGTARLAFMRDRAAAWVKDTWQDFVVRFTGGRAPGRSPSDPGFER
jgi:hypothetical protein